MRTGCGLPAHANGLGRRRNVTARRGKTGVDLSKGKFGVGVNAGANTIRLSEGTCIELDETGRVKIRYKAGRIEFLNGQRRVGHIDVSGDDHAL